MIQNCWIGEEKTHSNFLFR